MRGFASQTTHALGPSSQGLHAFSCLHPNGSGRKIIIVDTPGFGDSQEIDYEILKAIAPWLEET